MKSNYKFQLFLFMALVAALVWTGCSDDEDGKPFINYVRITDPSASDSLLVSAGQGQLIAIMGGNLASVREVWFNDRSALLIPTMVTNNTIIVRVPSAIPSDVTNKLRLVFSDGESLLHDFQVAINKPLVERLKSEWVNEGDTAIIYGDYFYSPITVTFAGGVEGIVISNTDTEVHVKVPAGAEFGPISVGSIFGETESEFWFRDNRNIIADFDGPLTAWVWRGPDYVFATDPVINSINGKFMRVNKGAQPAYPFLELYGGSMEVGSDIANVTKRLPDDALVNPADYSMKFEINTLESISGAAFRIYIGRANNADLGAEREKTYYVWNANEDTKGKWQTVTIPWGPIYEANKNFSQSTIGYAMFIYCHGPNAAVYNFALDNIRVVPN